VDGSALSKLMWVKLEKLSKNEIFGFFLKVSFLNVIILLTVWDVFHDLKNVKIAEKSLKIGQLLPILATFYEF
jgi:hypothetical protein